MMHYIVFGKVGQYTVYAESWVRAIQAVLIHADILGQPFAADAWQAHQLAHYNPTIRARLIRDSVAI